jgi:hypothetical protein
VAYCVDTFIIRSLLHIVFSQPEVWYSLDQAAHYHILGLYLFWGHHFWPVICLVTEQGISSSRELGWMERIYVLSVTYLICYVVQHSHKIWIYNVISSKHSNVLLPEAHVTIVSVVQKCYYSLYRPQDQEDISVDGVCGVLNHVYFYIYIYISLSLSTVVQHLCASRRKWIEFSYIQLCPCF